MVPLPQLSYSLEITDSPEESFFKSNKLSGSYYISEKIDGVRAILHQGCLYTRSGRKFSYVPEWFTRLFSKNVCLDGEIYIKGIPFSDFSTITILKNKEKAEEVWKNVIYYVFDAPEYKCIFSERLNYIQTEVNKIKHAQVKTVEFTLVKDIQSNFNQVNEAFKKILKSGGEGVMLVKADSLYENKRTRSLFKYKKLISGEATVIGFEEGIGKYTGKLGAFILKLSGMDVIFKCGTGLTDDLRSKYTFKNGKVNVSQDNLTPLVSDTITYECMELTKSGVPRMPVYKGRRVDI